MVYFVFIRNKGLFKVFAVTQQTAHLGNDASSRDGSRAFSVAGPTVWNSLSDFIRDPAISADCFRCLLKTYLFARH